MNETLSGVTSAFYIWYVRTHFSSMGMVLCNVGRVKCQPFPNFGKLAHELTAANKAIN